MNARVLQALRALGVTLAPADDARTAGWRLAVAIAPRSSWEWSDTYTRAAAHGLARALDAEDLAEAARCALWMVDPAAAMDAAVQAFTPASAVVVAPAVVAPAPTHHHCATCRGCRSLTVVSAATGRCLECAVPVAPAVPVAVRPSTRPTAIPANPRDLRDLTGFGIEQPWRVAS